MNWKNSTERYGTVSIALHWQMLLLCIAVYVQRDNTLLKMLPKRA
jgi:cytochrome b561